MDRDKLVEEVMEQYDLRMNPSSSHFSGIARYEIKQLTIHMLENKLFKKGRPVAKKDALPASHHRWKDMLNILGFTCSMSSSSGSSHWEINGVKEILGVGSLIYFYANEEGNKTTNQFVVNHRCSDGKFYSYTGNVEHFYFQVLKASEVIGRKKKLELNNAKFGLGECDTSMGNLLTALKNDYVK